MSWVPWFALPAAISLWAGSADADPVVRRFAATGAQQTLVIPHGVHAIDVAAIGGAGGNGVGNAGGGAGAKVTALLPVTPGDTLYVLVGGNGDVDKGGFNGGGPSSNAGGGGGGASDLRTVTSGAAGSLESRLLIAAGGGGSGAGSIPALPTGGQGGLVDGSHGTTDGTRTVASGLGATQTAGGAAGVGGVGDGVPTPGTLGMGGTGVAHGGGGSRTHRQRRCAAARCRPDPGRRQPGCGVFGRR